MHSTLAVGLALVAPFVATALHAQEPISASVPGLAPSLHERMARRKACTDAKVRQAIDAGLAWLLRHQDDDGRWDADDFGKHDPTPPPGDDKGNRMHDVGITALSLLSLLAEADVRHTPAITRGVQWLVANQNTDGRIGGDFDSVVYDHAIATQVLVEACALLERDDWRTPTTAALNWLMHRRNPGAAWRYLANGDNDTSVTSWCVAAMFTGHAAGFAVPPNTIGEPLAWVEDTTDRVYGRCGYSGAGEPSSRQMGDHMTRFPPEKGEAMTAAALHMRLLLGQDPTQAAIDAGSKLLLQKPPGAGDATAIDFYYWYHGSHAMALLPKAPAAKWFAALDAALLRLQRPKGDQAGSFDPTDVWGADSGRVGSTALAVLSLQARYRLGDLQPSAALPRTGPLGGLRKRLEQGDRAGALVQLCKLPTAAAADERAGRAVAALRWTFAVDSETVLNTIARLRAAKQPDWYRLHELLEHTRSSWAGSSLGERAAGELQQLQADSMARPHIEGGKRLRALRDRHRKPPRDPAPLLEQLRQLVADFPGTAAAESAQRWMHELRRDH